jgi:hypothetical protein
MNTTAVKTSDLIRRAQDENLFLLQPKVMERLGGGD